MDKDKEEKIFKTDIKGFDNLFEEGGIPKKSSVLIAGGTGTGKSIFCRQICHNLVSKGKNCVYISFEENVDKIEENMQNFGWNAKKHRENGHFIIQKIDPLDILSDKPSISKEFHPDVIVVDSLTAIISSIDKEKDYKTYLQQLLDFFEETGATSFLVAETEEIPTQFKIEEFLDGVVIFYNIQKQGKRENAIEIFKMRSSNHQKKKFAMEITNEGIKIPDVFLYENR